jgi:hypothetical protein
MSLLRMVPAISQRRFFTRASSSSPTQRIPSSFWLLSILKKARSGVTIALVLFRGRGLRQSARKARSYTSIAQQAPAEMQRKQQYAEKVVPAEISKEAAIVQAQAEAQRITIAAEAEGKRIVTIKQAEAVAADAEGKRIMALKHAEGEGVKAVLEGRAEGFRQLVASAGGNASEAVVVLVADQLPSLVDSQMKAIANLKIDKVVVWGGTESGKSGISSLLKDLITGLPR